MAAESNDPVYIWKAASRLMEGDGVAKDREVAHRYFARLESSTNVERLSRLALMLRCGWGVRMDIGESLRWYRRCCDLGDVVSLEHLGRCYEKGIGVDTDEIEAARFYELASEGGSRTGRLSLGVFHWRGLGGFRMDRVEAVRLWRLGGLEMPDAAVNRDGSISIRSGESEARSSRFFSWNAETELTGTPRSATDFLSLNEIGQISRSSSSFPAEPDSVQPLSVSRSEESDHCLIMRDQNRPEIEAADTDQDQQRSLTRDSRRTTCKSFALCTSGHVIESVVLADNRPVRSFLGEGRPALEIGRLAGEGISREGLRCLEGSFEGEEGRLLCVEMMECDTMESLLRTCAIFYTRNTLLSRRVNKFLRSGTEWDAETETGRNLGLYIGLLRECFCVSG
jgi:hypothetical protein